MNEMMLLGVLVVVSVGMMVYAMMPRKEEEDEKRLHRRMSGKRAAPEQQLLNDKTQRSAARQMLDRVAPYAMRPVMPKNEEDMSTLRQKLAQAGLRHESAVRHFLASKTIAAVLLGVISMAASWGSGRESMQLFGIAAFAAG